MSASTIRLPRQIPYNGRDGHAAPRRAHLRTARLRH
jgi:hypothetical protein